MTVCRKSAMYVPTDLLPLHIFLIQVNNCLDKEFQGYRVSDIEIWVKILSESLPNGCIIYIPPKQ